MKDQVKICLKCNLTKPISEFGKERRNKKSGLKSRCKLCVNYTLREYKLKHPTWEHDLQQYYKKTCPQIEMLKNARIRAKKRNRVCTITRNDLTIPKFCPILGIPLESAVKFPTENSPSLDEIVVGNGYTPENIQIISRKANTMKSNATPEELIKFANWIYKTYVKAISTTSTTCDQDTV